MLIVKVCHDGVSQQCKFWPTNRKTNPFFNPSRVDITLDGVPSKIHSQSMLPRHFFEEAYRVLSGSNREISADANQLLNETGFFLNFTRIEYYAGSRQPLVIDCRTVADGHI